MTEFLSLKELHRQPRPRTRQTSAQARYLTANTHAAQRLRALGQNEFTTIVREQIRA